MDDVARSGRVLLRAAPIAIVAFAAACHAPALQGIGRARDVPAVPTVTAPPASAERVSAPTLAPDFASRLVRVGPDSFVSWGHAEGLYASTLYVTPTVKSDLFADAPGRPFPPGTEIVMVNVDRTTHAPGPTFFMQKDDREGGTWRFGSTTSNGSPDRDREGGALCARCHAEAPRDHVFAVAE